MFKVTTKSLISAGMLIVSLVGMAEAQAKLDILSDYATEARLADLAYDNSLYKEGSQISINGEEWRVINFKKGWWSGFRAISLQSQKTGKIAIAFRGTDGVKAINDVATDVLLATNFISRQQNSAVEFIGEVYGKHPDADPEDFLITGHSLGGSLAQTVGAVMRVRTVTFNAAPVRAKSVVALGISYEQPFSNITNFRVEGDPISELLLGEKLSIGQDITIPKIGGCKLKKCHDIKPIVAEADKQARIRASGERISAENIAGEQPQAHQASSQQTETNVADTFPPSGGEREAVNTAPTSETVPSPQRSGPTEEERRKQAQLEEQRRVERREQERKIREAREKRRKADLDLAVRDRAELSRQQAELGRRKRDAENRLAVLKYDEIEKAQNELRDINRELQVLRDRKAAQGGLYDLREEKAEAEQQLKFLAAALSVRRSVSNGASISDRQKSALSKLAHQFGIYDTSGQAAWSKLLMSAERLISRTRNKIADYDQRIARMGGGFTSRDQARFDQLMRRQQVLQGRQDSLADRIRSTEAKVSKLDSELSKVNARIGIADSRIATLQRDGDVIDYQSFEVKAYAVSGWVPKSLYDDYGQLNETFNYDLSEDLQAEEAIRLAGIGGQPEEPVSSIPEPVEPPTTTPGEAPVLPVDPAPVEPPTTTPLHETEAGDIELATFLSGGNVDSSRPGSWKTYGESDVLNSGDETLDYIFFQQGAEADTSVPTIGDRSGSFSYLNWGKYAGAVDAYGESSIQNMFWLYGVPTPGAALEPRTGSASYSGDLYGHSLDTAGPDAGVRYDAVTGGFNFNVDFASDFVDGNGYVDGLYVDRLNFGLSGDFSTAYSGASRTVSGATDTGSFSVSPSAHVVASVSVDDVGNNGRTGNGYFYGNFFGPGAQEFGGNFALYTGDDAVVGIAVGSETIQPESTVDYSNYKGLTSYSYAGEVSDFMTDFASVESVSEDGFINFEGAKSAISSERDIADGSAFEGLDERTYQYTAWGSWGSVSSDDDGLGNTINVSGQDRFVQSGNWLIYEPTENLPTQGTASYTGQLKGVIADSFETVGGTIDVSADFELDQIVGSLDINRSGGGKWADASFDTSIQRNSSGVGFEGPLSSGGLLNNGAIFGGFAGPNAEEVAGGWELDHKDGSSANGIFRAQQ